MYIGHVQSIYKHNTLTNKQLKSTFPLLNHTKYKDRHESQISSYIMS